MEEPRRRRPRLRQKRTKASLDISLISSVYFFAISLKKIVRQEDGSCIVDNKSVRYEEKDKRETISPCASLVYKRNFQNDENHATLTNDNQGKGSWS
jgi:hypothetical protein